jgi:acyl carrier protein
MNFLELLNGVARVAKPIHQNLKPLESMDERFENTEIDSLDGLLIVMYMSELYGIADEVSKDFTPQTPQELHDFIQQHKTTEPESIEAALEQIK